MPTALALSANALDTLASHGRGPVAPRRPRPPEAAGMLGTARDTHAQILTQNSSERVDTRLLSQGPIRVLLLPSPVSARTLAL
jgi:hypothetical protein